MVFEHWRSVLSGQKTQFLQIARTDKPPLRVGQSLLVQPAHGKKAVCKIMITRIGKKFFRELTEVEAKAEGFADVGSLCASWTRKHGMDGLSNPLWIFEFALKVPAPRRPENLVPDC